MNLPQRETRQGTLLEWRFTSAQAIFAIAWIISSFCVTTSRNGFAEIGRNGPPSVRIPVVDGDDIRFSRLSTAQGLSQTRVAQIVQDDQGFMWFGTEYGLDRYDGYEYKVFTHDPTRENSLSCVYIHSLFKDHSGTLWIGCDQFLDRFDAVSETFTHYRIGTEVTGEVANIVEEISQDRTGMLWLATARGLFGLNPDTGQIIHYAHDPTNRFSLSSNRVRCTLEDRGGRFWIADGNNLEEFDRKSRRVLFRAKLDDGTRDTTLFEDHMGVLWVAYVTSGKGSGLAALDRSASQLVPYLLYDHRTRKNLYGGIRAITEDQSHTLWLATFGAPLLKFDRQHKLIIRYRNHPDNPESIAEDRAIALCADHEGNVWVGMQAQAPNFFRPEGVPFKSLALSRSDPRSFGEAFVNAILEDHYGELWVATVGAVNRIDRKSGRSLSYDLPGEPEQSDSVVTIAEDRAGALWFGTYGNGVIRFDRRTGRYKRYSHDASKRSSLSNDIVSRLLVDHSATLWLATYDGLDRFDPRTETFFTYKQDSKSEAEEYFNLAEDKGGLLWMGSWGGLNRFDPKSGQFKVYAHRSSDADSLSDNAVTSVVIDHSGTIWVSTENGLNKLNRESGKFTHYFVKDGLPSNAVSCILEDKVGMLWMSTSRGLSRFNPIGKRFTNYSSVDGLPGNDLTGWDACFKSPSGEMFFGGFSGGVAFFPDKVTSTPYPLPLVLTDLHLNGNLVEVGPNSPLSRSISRSSDLTLTYHQNVFSLGFAALTFSNPDANRYRYRLDQLEHDWVEVGSDRRVATYTTLPAGKYTFRLQTATRQGNWNEPGLALRITILPPWWGTWRFRLTCLLALGGLLWTFYLLRLRQMGAEIRARIEERLGERDRIARELHDTLLQGIQGLILRFHAVAEQIPASEATRQTIEQALDRADEVLVQGRDRVNNLRVTSSAQALPEALTGAIKDLAFSKGVEFRVIVEGEPHDLHPLVRDEVYWIGHEALANALKHANPKCIEVEIGYDPAQFRLRLRDDGCGIDPDIIETGGKPGHWGIRGMRERATRIGAQLETWSKPETGTELELKIPGTIAYATRRGCSRWRKLRQLWCEEIIREPYQSSNG
jgi:ligand-binding sensor domain-containing protein/signal transduction histidine kinase